MNAASPDALDAQLAQARAELDARGAALAKREAAVRAAEEQLKLDRARLQAEAKDGRTQLDAERTSVLNERARLRR